MCFSSFSKFFLSLVSIINDRSVKSRITAMTAQISYDHQGYLICWRTKTDRCHFLQQPGQTIGFEGSRKFGWLSASLDKSITGFFSGEPEPTKIAPGTTLPRYRTARDRIEENKRAFYGLWLDNTSEGKQDYDARNQRFGFWEWLNEYFFSFKYPLLVSNSNLFKISCLIDAVEGEANF